MQDIGELFNSYKQAGIQMVAIKEEMLRQGFLPPVLVVETEAFVGTLELDTQGSFPRLVAESKARHAAKAD